MRRKCLQGAGMASCRRHGSGIRPSLRPLPLLPTGSLLGGVDVDVIGGGGVVGSIMGDVTVTVAIAAVVEIVIKVVVIVVVVVVVIDIIIVSIVIVVVAEDR